MIFSSKCIVEVIRQNNINVKKGDFSLMKESHILLCGGKAMYSYWHNDVIISLIYACGGHGLLSSAGFERLMSPNFCNMILEGDMTILL